MYDNEDDIGYALKKLEKSHGIQRSEFLLTTKILPGDTSYKGAYKTVSQSLKDFQTDYIDLVLIHWPTSDYKERNNCWVAMQELYKKGTIKNIGVSNFTKVHLENLKADPRISIVPCINQIEIHPLYIDSETIKYCRENNILLESYCPFAQNHTELMKNKTLAKIAKKYTKSIPQIILRWHYENGFIPIPRSNNTKHILENSLIFDFELTKSEIKEIDNLNCMDKTDWDPYSIEK